MKKLLCAAAMIGLCAAPFAAANAVPFSAGNAFVNGLGDQIGSTFDSLSIAGRARDLDPAASRTIADLVFDVGPNCTTCTSLPSGQLGFTLMVGSVTETANVGWAWSSTGPKDSLAITAPSDMTYVQADGEVDVVSFVATPTLLMGTGGPVNGSLTASVDVPEPLTIAVLGTGLFGIGLVRRRQPTVR